MENANRALLMAGGVLLGLILLSMMVYLFSNASNMNRSYDSSMEEDEIQSFNSKIERYTYVNANSSEKEIFAQDIVSLANFVYNYNNKVQNAKSLSIELIVVVDARDRFEVTPDYIPNLNCFIKNRTENYNFADFLKTYTKEEYDVIVKEVGYSETTGRINKVVYNLKHK